MHRLLEILALLWRIDRRNITVVGILTPINAVTTVIAAFSLKLIVDAVEAGDARLGILAVALAAFTLGAAPALMHVQHVLQRLVSDKLAVDIDRQTLDLIAETPSVAYAENPKHLDRIELVLDQGRDLAASLWAFSGLVVTILRLGLSALLLGMIHPALAALPLFALPVMWFAWVGRRHVKRAEQAAAEDQRVSKSLGDMFLSHSAMMEMKLFGATGKISTLAGEAGQRVVNIRFWGGLRGGFLVALGWVIFGTGFAAAFLLASQLYIGGRAALGDFVLIWQLTVGSLFYISFVLDRLQELFRAMEVFAHLDWLRAFSHEERQQWDAKSPERLPEKMQTGLALSGISFTYPGASKPTLSHLSLDLKAGSVVAIVGGNGAGKSSLAKILLGLYRPDSGRMEVDGVAVDQLMQRRGNTPPQPHIKTMLGSKASCDKASGLARSTWLMTMAHSTPLFKAVPQLISQLRCPMAWTARSASRSKRGSSLREGNGNVSQQHVVF